MQLSDVVGALSVLVTGLSAWFLARGIPKLDVRGLNDIGQGMKIGSCLSVFGANHRQVQDACRKQTDASVGLTLLVCGLVGYLLARIVPETRVVPLAWALLSLTLFTCAMAAALAFLSKAITASFLMRRITELLEDRHEDHLARGHPFRPTPDYHDRLTQDIARLLEGLISSKRVAAFATQLEADLQRQFGAGDASLARPEVAAPDTAAPGRRTQHTS